MHLRSAARVPVPVFVAMATLLAFGALAITSSVFAATGPDMVLSKSASASSVPLGGNVTYTLVAENIGNQTATGVRIRDSRLDPWLTVDPNAITTTKGTCGLDATNNLVCRINSLAPGETVTVTVPATIVTEKACDFVRNRARTNATNEPTANRDNNVSENVKVDVECPPDEEPPTGSIAINKGAAKAWGPKVLLSLTASDNRRGNLQMRISNSNELTDGGLLANAVTEPFLATKRWSLTRPDRGGTPDLGDKTVYVQFQDRAGNWSALFSDSIRMRRDAPNSCAGALAGTRSPLNLAFREQIYPHRDVDWFKFRIRSRSDVTVRLSQLPLKASLVLYNARCEVRAASNNPGRQAEVIRKTLPAGRYLVRVRPVVVGANSINTYLLKFSR